MVRENFAEISDSLKLTYPYDRMVVFIMMLKHAIARLGVSLSHQNHSAIERLLCWSVSLTMTPYFFSLLLRDPRLVDFLYFLLLLLFLFLIFPSSV